VIRAAYAPTPDDVAAARAVLAAGAGAGGAFALDGRMVDGPVLAQAHAVLRRAGVDTRHDEEVRR
jgi:citrate lyase subunit beta/citryl-CoA lyase